MMRFQKENLTTVLKIVAALALLYFGTQQYNIPARLKYLFFYNGYFGCAIFILVWVVSILAMCVSTFLPNILMRSFLALLFFLSTVMGLTYLQVSGAIIIYDNLFVLLENARFASGAVKEYTHELFLPVLAASLSFIMIIPPVTRIKHFFSAKRISVLAYTIAILPFFLILSIAIARGGYGIDQTPIQYNIPALFSLIMGEKLFIGEKDRNSVDYAHLPIKAEHKPNVVLIVDESQRGDYLDINSPDKNLTPSLIQNQAHIYNFGLSSSGGNLSAESNQILRFGPNIDNFNTTFSQNPYIWQYARKAGYKTIMLEGQAPEGVLNDRMSKKETAFIDQFIYIHGTTSYEKDLEIARLIKKFTEKPSDTAVFIYAVKRGMHFPYDGNVPEDQRIYKTTGSGFEVISKTDMVNSYKNAVHYVNDAFFTSLFDGTSFKNTIIFYTSDHGQNLLDNGYRITHGSTENVSCFEGLVPLMVITADTQYTQKFKAASAKNYNKAGHFNIFPSILEIFGYNPDEIKPFHGLSLFNEIKTPRKFLSGLLTVGRLNIGSKNQNKWNAIPDSLVATPPVK